MVTSMIISIVLQEGEPMRLIDADALYETLCNVWYRSDSKDFENAVFEIIQKAPDAQPEQKKGKWINGKCSECGEHAPFWCMASTYHESNYCPNCGSYNGGDEE